MTSPQQEYAAARSSAAVFDLANWTQVELAGADRAKFLHNFCTNEIRTLAPGTLCEAFITNVQGKVLAHVFVLAGTERLELIAAPGSSEQIIRHLARYQINEEVTFSDRTGERGLLVVVGPDAARVLEKLCGGAPAPGPGEHKWVSAGGLEIHIARNDFLGATGFLIVCLSQEMAGLRTRLAGAGALPGSPAVFAALRIEAAFPLYGVDITDANLAQEVNRTTQAISFSKGCYLGQEPIARIDALGHVNQLLRGIRLRESPAPPAGSTIVTAEVEPRKIGQITSSALSPSTNLPFALGYLKRNFDMPGLEVAVTVEGRKIAGEVF